MFATANPAAAAISKTSARLILEAPAVLDSIAIPEDVIFKIIALLTNPVNEHFDSVPGKEIGTQGRFLPAEQPVVGRALGILIRR
jgi:hypothetical protein